MTRCRVQHPASPPHAAQSDGLTQDVVEQGAGCPEAQGRVGDDQAAACIQQADAVDDGALEGRGRNGTAIGTVTNG